MSKTSTVTIAVVSSGDGVAQNYSLEAIENTAAPAGGPAPQSLSSGFNSVSVPTGARGVIIRPPAGSVITKTLKGITGDTGIALAPDKASYIGLPAGATTIGITASSAEVVDLFWV